MFLRVILSLGLSLGLGTDTEAGYSSLPTTEQPGTSTLSRQASRFCPRCCVVRTTAGNEEANNYLIVTIPTQASLFAVADCLIQAGLLRSKWAFVFRVLLKGARRQLKAGQYRFASGASIDTLIETLVQGATLIHKITIPEGLTVSAVVQLVREHPCLSGEVITIPEEGQLLPGTYHVQEYEARQAVLERMRRAMEKSLSEIAPLSPLSPEKLLTLASIVEKETQLPSEKGHVASVFLARLQKGMPLQADPTVIYGLTLGQKPLGRLPTRADWKIDSPYNTYRYKGLPPTPICCPSTATLQATATATPGSDLFFVADGSGGHRFSSTLKEHNSNIQEAKKRTQQR